MSKGETQNNSDSTTGHLKRVAYTSFLCPEVVVLVGGSLWDGGRRGVWSEGLFMGQAL